MRRTASCLAVISLVDLVSVILFKEQHVVCIIAVNDIVVKRADGRRAMVTAHTTYRSAVRSSCDTELV